MDSAPLVSIVVPVFNDENVISAALDSCLAQTLGAVEVVVIDDASTDDTAKIVERYAASDDRVRLVRQPVNGSAYQARRIGVLTATADHLLFLDGDDELLPQAVEIAYEKARSSRADLVQFGVEVVHRDGRSGGKFESRLQPRHATLTNGEVLSGLFPIDSAAQGQLWKYMFRRELLANAYSRMPSDLVLPRVNDLPIAFLAAALATRYESVPDRLYRYHFGRGGSGQKVQDLDTASFYAGAIHSIDSIASAVGAIAASSPDSAAILAAYASVRRAIIGYTTHYLAEHTRPDLLDAVFADLYTKAPAREVVEATAQHWPADVDTLARHAEALPLVVRSAKSVLLATNRLRTGGISAVIVSQARLLHDAGYHVIIAAREPGSDISLVPSGVVFREIAAAPLGTAIIEWTELCAREDVDVVIEHQWQYASSWAMFALAARTVGASTIGWAHNFAGRSILLGLGMLEHAPRYFGLLQSLVVLSLLDVAFWKLRGMPRVAFLPNPPSTFLVEAGVRPTSKDAPTDRRVELIWWGRLQERTKRVSELLDVAEHLERMGVDFHLRIVGPNWRDMSAERLNAGALDRGLAHRVSAVGPLRGADLLTAIDSSDMFVNTSVIEGYPLSIPEAQARGLPVVMYDLPWLAVAESNEGIAAVKWGDSRGLAHEIASIASDADRFSRLTSAALDAARRELNYDFATLYQQLISGELPSLRSPEPTIGDAQRLIDLTIRFSEHRSNDQVPAPTTPTAQRPNGSDAASGPYPIATAGFVRRKIVSLANHLRLVVLALRHQSLRRR